MSLFDEMMQELCDLRAENKRLREALRPFAGQAVSVELMHHHDKKWYPDNQPVGIGVTMGDLRRAAEAVKEGI